MDELIYGARDRRGNWTPHARPKAAPVFVWPARPKALLRWLPGYIWGVAVYALLAAGVWTWFTPALAEMREFGVGTFALILVRNLVLTVVVYGTLHIVLYVLRHQQTAFKYNAKWPSKENSTFLFGSQTAENIAWTMCSGVPVWTCYEVLMLWMFANGYIPYVDFALHPWYCIALLLVFPLWGNLHFYLTHRLIHVGPLYHLVHKVHHKNVNPGPWTGLSMHTVEHLVYFSGALIFCLVPGHPLHVINALLRPALASARGHSGFDRIALGEENYINTDNYRHYLHHKYFEVNYGEGLIPFDEWFGTLHDGTPEAERAMYERMKAKKPVAVGEEI